MIYGKIDTIAFGGEGILRVEGALPLSPARVSAERGAPDAASIAEGIAGSPLTEAMDAADESPAADQKLAGLRAKAPKGYVVFVPFTAPGDEVAVELTRKKKRYGTGKLVSIEKPSPLRTQPLCPYFGTCGGCQLQHIHYPAQLELKRKFIQDAFQKIGNVCVDLPPITPATTPWHYRRHIRLKLKPDGGGTKAGYTGWDNQTFIPVEQCPIFTSLEDPILREVQEFLQQVSFEAAEEASVRIFKDLSDTYLLVFSFPFASEEKALEWGRRALEKFPRWRGVLIQTQSQTVALGKCECTLDVLGLHLAFSPFGFIQNNPEQSENLYRTLLENTPPTATKVLDLFCGIGVTSLLFAQRNLEVVGIESHAETVKLAQANSERNSVTQARFLTGKAEKIAPALLRQMQPDLVLCNPPRIGLDPSLGQALLTARPEHLFYVSCMPATLARDLRPFLEEGYAIESIQGFDMFPQTTHVETLVKLRDC